MISFFAVAVLFTGLIISVPTRCVWITQDFIKIKGDEVDLQPDINGSQGRLATTALRRHLLLDTQPHRENNISVGASNSSAVLTTFDPVRLQNVVEQGCRQISKLTTQATIEAKKLSRDLRFAILYSGRLCQGRSMNALQDQVRMRDLWSNHETMVHTPLAQWGDVQLFGLFEASVVAECNNISELINWTQLEFMPSEMAENPSPLSDTFFALAKTITRGEERRAEVLRRFIGIENWRKYDFFLHFRPDTKFRRPITEWGLNLQRINVPHWESSGPRECDAAKLSRAATTAAIKFPAVGDVYIMYPQRWAPFFLNFGSLIMGRAVGQWLLAYYANKGQRTITTGRFRGQLVCSPANPTTFLARDFHVVETAACHTSRSCLYHPHYYLYGERLCGELGLRDGESAVEACHKGSASDETGYLSCGKSVLKRWRASSPDDQAEELRWFNKHYHPYVKMELYPCMKNSTSGQRCARGAGGYPSLEELHHRMKLYRKKRVHISGSESQYSS